MDKKIMALLVISLFVLVGCTKDQVSTSMSKAFIGGTDAVEFDFVEGSPPAEVYDGGSYPFEVALNVENKGEYDVAKENITIELAGFYPADFSLTQESIIKNPEEDLERSQIEAEGNIIPGTVTYVTFPRFNFTSSLSANNEYKIRANVCYVYGTKAQADICILDDLTKSNDKVCKVTEQKTVHSSSGPIQIEGLEESIAGTDRVTFSFEVVHRGSGAISQKETDCSDETIGRNKVWVEVNNNLTGLECSGLSDGTATTGFTTLYSGKRMIRCTQPTDNLQGDFEKKVKISAVYDYKEHKQVDLVVKHTT
ncbi:MAG: hypothetical protein U9O94_00830 [Nanoarchaeota archaeon]|nr:hypothetical protein [Nanoarchaeota archaeon]